MKTTNAIVRDALAHHLELDPSMIEPWQHLEVDLYMAPHDLAAVARELADLEDVVFSIDQLAPVATVGDLQVLLSRAIARARPGRALERVA